MRSRMLRGAWSLWSAGVAACFVTGCLFRSPPDLEADLARAHPPPPPTPAEAPAVLSPYGARPAPPVARLSASVEPSLERVHLEVTPRPLPKLQPPEPPPPRESALVAALRCAVEKHPDEAGQLLQKYDPADRQLLLALLRLTAGIGAGAIDRMPPGEVDATLDRLAELTLHLRRRAPLALRQVCFCRSIDGFGLYDPLRAGSRFQAGVDGRPGERVQVYAEVRNFACARRDGRHETALTSSLEIRDGQGRPVVTMNLPACVDRSQTPRQDYFLNFQFHVPSRLPPGLYTLWVIVRDVTPAGAERPAAPRVARRSLDFHVCPPGSRQQAARR